MVVVCNRDRSAPDSKMTTRDRLDYKILDQRAVTSACSPSSVAFLFHYSSRGVSCDDALGGCPPPPPPPLSLPSAPASFGSSVFVSGRPVSVTPPLQHVVGARHMSQLDPPFEPALLGPGRSVPTALSVGLSQNRARRAAAPEMRLFAALLPLPCAPRSLPVSRPSR